MSEEVTQTQQPSTPQQLPVIDSKLFDELKTVASRQAEILFNQKLKEITGVESLDQLAELKKVEEDKKLLERGEYEKLTSQVKEEAQSWKGKYQDSLSRQSILKACLDHNVVDEEAILALVKSSTVVDEHGNVSINSKPVDEAIKELLKAKPYLVKPTRTGSSSPSYPESSNDQYKEDYEKAKKEGNIAKLLELKRKAV